MRYFLTLLILCFYTLTIALANDDLTTAPAILSIIPGQASPGATVVISGTGFASETSLYLGIDEIPLKSASSRQLFFEIPQIPAGNYALYILRKDGLASKSYSFTVTPLKPSVTAIQPDTVSLCAQGNERQITIKGKNFLEGSRVVFDGAIIKSSRASGEEMIFTTPPVNGGLHQVQIKTPEDVISSATALIVASRPEIESVTQGNDYVTYYELKIEGVNFQNSSTLIVDGKKIQVGQQNPGERDRLIFNSCTRLTYQRYPYDPTMKIFQMVIVNQNGEESSTYTVSAP